MKCETCGENIKIPPDWRAIGITFLVLILVGFLFFYMAKNVDVLREDPCSLCERAGFACFGIGSDTGIPLITNADIENQIPLPYP